MDAQTNTLYDVLPHTPDEGNYLLQSTVYQYFVAQIADHNCDQYWDSLCPEVRTRRLDCQSNIF